MLLPSLRLGCRQGQLTVAVKYFSNLWLQEGGQDIAEYAIMLGVILAIVVATVQLIGSSANNVFSSVASSLQ